MDQNSDVVVTLKNQIAELEEEKGNLQLQLLDTDESKTGQQCSAAVLCHDVALFPAAVVLSLSNSPLSLLF